jgi:hypothetical protein
MGAAQIGARFTMTPAEINTILIAVPIGRDNAEGWKAIWERLEQDAPTTLRWKLSRLADDGVIMRRQMPDPLRAGFRWVYWREGTRPVLDANSPSTVLGAG